MGPLAMTGSGYDPCHVPKGADNVNALPSREKDKEKRANPARHVLQCYSVAVIQKIQRKRKVCDVGWGRDGPCYRARVPEFRLPRSTDIATLRCRPVARVLRHGLRRATDTIRSLTPVSCIWRLPVVLFFARRMSLATRRTSTDGAGMVPSDLFPTLCGESQDLGELLNPPGQDESLGGGDRSLFFLNSFSEGDCLPGFGGVAGVSAGDVGDAGCTGGGAGLSSGGGATMPPIHMMPYFAQMHPMYQLPVPAMGVMGSMGSMGTAGAAKAENAQSAVASGRVVPPTIGMVPPTIGMVPPTIGMVPPAPSVVPSTVAPTIAAPMQPYYQGYYTYQQYINGNLMTFTVPYAMVTPPSSSDSDAPAAAAFPMPSVYRMGNSKMSAAHEGMLRRMKAVERYRKKKERRSFRKNVRYQLRKENAEKRVRVKGRFAKKED